MTAESLDAGARVMRAAGAQRDGKAGRTVFLILAVESCLQKYFRSRLTQIKSISLAVPFPRGALAIVTDVGRDAMDADSAADERR